MRQKRTPTDDALWAALPMAQTSQIEGRLALILDRTRRRTSPRRFLFIAATSAAALLLPLAMLRPTAKAQAVSPAASKGLVEIVSITNAANGEGWDVNGKPLSEPDSHWTEWIENRKFTAKPGQKALFVAFRLSPSLRNVPVVYDVSGTTLDGIILFARGNTTLKGYGATRSTMRSIQIQSSDDTLIYGAAFPASLARTKIRVGAATGPWTTASTIHCHFKQGIPVVNITGGQYAGTIALSDGKIKYSLPTKTPDDFYDLRFIARDKNGHDSLLPAIKTESKNGREQGMVRQPPHLSRLRDIRVEIRPLVWTEFKNVALQPSQDASLVSPVPASQNEAVPAQNYATRWTSQIIKSKWQPRTTFHLALHFAPAVSGMRPEPPVMGQIVSGPGTATHFSVKAWKPGRSNFPTVKFDYTPKAADKAHPDIIHLLTNQGDVAAVITYYSI